MGIGAGLYMFDVVVKKFTFAILSPDEFLHKRSPKNYWVDFNQILHSDKDHQTPFVGGPSTRITNPRWQSAAILNNEKPIYRGNGIIDHCQIWHDDAFWPAPSYGPLLCRLSKDLSH